MKRMFSILLAAGLLFLLSIQCFAFDETSLNPNGFESLPLSEDFEEISSTLLDLLARVNNLIDFQYPDRNVEITPEDIQWENAYQIYIETDLYSTGTDSAAQILTLLDQAKEQHNSIWQLPISKDGIYLTVDYSIQEPLPDSARSAVPEEEYNAVMAQVGKWHTSTVSFWDTAETYRSLFLSSLETAHQTSLNSRKIFLGGFPKMRSVVGITMNSERVEKVIPLEEPNIAAYPEQRAARNAVGGLQKGHVYEFDQVAQYMSTIHPQDTGAAGGASNAPDAVLTIVLLCTAVIVAVAGGLVWKCRSVR